MQVAKYTFQSPSTSQVQVGRLDPSSVKEEKSSSQAELPSSALNKTAAEAQSFAQTQVKEVKPTLSENSIDLYV